MSAVDCTSKKHLVSYRITSDVMFKLFVVVVCTNTRQISQSFFFKLDTDGTSSTKQPTPSDAISAQTRQQQQQQYCAVFESAAPCPIHLRQGSTHVHILITRAPTCTRRLLLLLLLTLLQARFHCYQNCGQWVNASITARKDIPYKVPRKIDK